MKTHKSTHPFILSIVSAFCILHSAFAQDASGTAGVPPASPIPAHVDAAMSATNTVATKTPAPLQLLGAGVTAGYQQLTQLSFSNGIAGGLFGIRHGGDYGGGLFVRTANPAGVNVGFGLAGIYEKVKDPVTLKTKSELNFYDCTINVSLNGTTVIPLLNYPVDYVLESGPAANLKDVKTVYEQSLVGVEKTFKLGNKFAMTIEVGEGHCSRWGSGFFQEAAFLATYKPHGW